MNHDISQCIYHFTCQSVTNKVTPRISNFEPGFSINKTGLHTYLKQVLKSFKNRCIKQTFKYRKHENFYSPPLALLDLLPKYLLYLKWAKVEA